MGEDDDDGRSDDGGGGDDGDDGGDDGDDGGDDDSGVKDSSVGELEVSDEQNGSTTADGGEGPECPIMQAWSSDLQTIAPLVLDISFTLSQCLEF